MTDTSYASVGDKAKRRGAVLPTADTQSGAALSSTIRTRRRASIVRRRGTLVRRAFVVADVSSLLVSFFVAEAAFGVQQASWDNHLRVGTERLVFVLSLPVWLFIFKLYGLYRNDEERTDHSTADDVLPLFHGVTISLWLFEGLSWVTQLAQPKFPKVLFFWALTLVLVTTGRVLARQICRRSPNYIQNTVIVGSDSVGRLIARKLQQHPEYGLNVLGFVADEPTGLDGDAPAVPYLGVLAGIGSIVREREVERVIVATAEAGVAEIAAVHELKRSDVQIDIVPRLFEVVGPDVEVHKVEGIPLLGLPTSRLSWGSLVMKRAIDVTVAAAALVLFSPLFAWIAWRVHRDSPGPIFFRQRRLGLNMRELTMLKFRTMSTGTDAATHRDYIRQIMDKSVEPNANGLYKLEREEEVTPFGRWLRKTSLDELPQLINVLRGDMSLVGPRPCLPYEVDHFEPHHFERFSVPAGMTGLWQVTARARATFVEALEMDVAYARGWSLGLDLWLMARTPLQLLTRKGTA